jgi:hypothetical protein
VQELRSGPSSREEIIPRGHYRSNPCREPVRLVSGVWQGAWSRSLTNVREPQRLSARQVCALSRRRWRIEEALALTNRVLDWSYWWTGSTHAVQWQLYATLIFSAVLLTLCQQVAEVWGEPLARSSGERVLRACDHSSQAVQGGEADELVRLLAAQAKLLGIVKRWRKHHRERQQLEYLIWEVP